jgi:tRNA (uracil-5-)-methyltransferase TRM9
MCKGKMEQEEVWDSIAERWDSYRSRTAREVVEFLENKNGKILDLGCGSGRNFVDNKNLEIYGIDFSEKLLEFAKKRNYVELKKGEGDKIPYDDNFFDSIICFSVLHCIDSAEKRKKTAEELFRVLKPGSELLISVWGRGSPRVKNKKKEDSVNWNVGGIIYKRYTYMFDKKEFEELVKNAGFKIVRSWEDKNINLIVSKPISS